jgi:hypothetical protein
MEFKGTKGEWEVSILNQPMGAHPTNRQTLYNLQNKSEDIHPTKEHEANAKLIAAAPILLKEHLMDLKHLYTWRSKLINAGLKGDVLWNEYTDMIDAKEEAINKALKF